MTKGDKEKYDKARKARKAFPISDRPSSSSRNAAISAPVACHEHKRRRLVKPASTPGGQINCSGSTSANMNRMVPVIDLTDEPEGREENTSYALEIRRSPKQELKKPRASVQMSSEHVRHGELLHQPGSDSEELGSEEAEMNDEEGFMNRNSYSDTTSSFTETEGRKARRTRNVNELHGIKDQPQEGMRWPNKGAEDNKKLHPIPKDRSQAGVRRPKKAAAKEESHKACAVQEDDKKVCKENMVNELHPKHKARVDLGNEIPPAEDIMPEWIERPNRGSARKIYSKREETSESNEVNFQSSIANVADTVWSINPGARESLYEHQREGFEFLWRNLAGSIYVDEVKSKSSDSDGVGGCIISHAPGTGKTRLTIVFLESYLRMFPNSLPVIIAPAGMLLSWEEEFKKWNVGYSFLNLNNNNLSVKDKSAVGYLTLAKTRDLNCNRTKINSWSRGGSVLGISCSLFENLVGENKTNMKRDNEMRQILVKNPGLVVLDEGPRNQSSNIWNALLKLETQKRVIITGTPFQNNFLELFNTLRIVRPAVADMLASRRMSSSREHKGAHGHSESCLENLKVSMSPFVHVHKGTILQQSLPGLTDSVVVLQPTALQKSLIEGIQESNCFKNEHVIALISVHPSLFLHEKSTKAQLEGIDMEAVIASKLKPLGGVKTRFVVELVRLSTTVDEKVLVFSQYIQPLDFIMEQLKKVLDWVDGREILMMKGKLGQKQRQTLIKSFNDPKGKSKIMLASTRCCSKGISLVGASRVVLLDVEWNPSVERQAISRAYRIGQKKCVYTYHLMTSGTNEAEKYCKQVEKERLSDLVFTSANEQSHPSECEEDRILKVMSSNEDLKEIFEKIINQPKETADLPRAFGL